MKNLKKLNRKEQKEIKGSGIRRCTNNSQCFGGWCCNNVCVVYACMEN
ncbi:bacteriocin-like protein [Chryseobacterium piperi]